MRNEWAKGRRRTDRGKRETQGRGRVEYEGRGGRGAAAFDSMPEAAVCTCLSRIFEMGTECEHGAIV